MFTDLDTLTIIVTLVSVMGSAGAWQFYTRRSELSAAKERSITKLVEEQIIIANKEDQQRLESEVMKIRDKLHSIQNDKIELAARLATLESSDIEFRRRLDLLETIVVNSKNTSN